MLAALARWFRQASEEVGFWPALMLFASPLILFALLVILMMTWEGFRKTAERRKEMKKGFGSYRYVVDLVSIALLMEDRDRQRASGVPLSDQPVTEVLGACAYRGIVAVFGQDYADINPRYMSVFTYLKDAPGSAVDHARAHEYFKAAAKYCDPTYKNLIILCAYCSLLAHREEGSTTVYDEGVLAVASDLYGSREAADAVLDGLFARADELMSQEPAGAAPAA